MSQSNLTTADLRYATLTNANFNQANLTNANLAYATLTSADLTQANLTNANFQSGDLTAANLTGAELRGANFFRSYDGVGGISLMQLYSHPTTRPTIWPASIWDTTILPA